MADHTQTLSLILSMIRSGIAVTRPELTRQTGLGRTIITQRVEDAIRAGLLVEGDHAPSTGGRPSRTLRIAPGRAVVLAVVFGATRLHAAVVDLDGTFLDDQRMSWDIEAGPEESLATLHDLSAKLLPPNCVSGCGASAWGCRVRSTSRAGYPFSHRSWPDGRPSPSANGSRSTTVCRFGSTTTST